MIHKCKMFFNIIQNKKEREGEEGRKEEGK